MSETPNNAKNGWLVWVALFVGLGIYESRSSKRPTATRASPPAIARSPVPSAVPPHQGSLATRGGSATVRRPYIPQYDDPDTTNDESNDQPIGYFGTLTLDVCSNESGNCYTLDGEMSGPVLERIYFPRGGWIDFEDCELDEDFVGECEDEEGRSWEIQGEG